MKDNAPTLFHTLAVMWTMEETAQFAQTTMRRSRGTAVLLAVGAVVLLGLAVGRVRRARPARDRDARPGASGAAAR